MEIEPQSGPSEQISDIPPKKNSKRLGFTIVIGIALMTIGYFSYAFITHNSSAQSLDEKSASHPPRVIQLDVLNGCGAKGAGAKFTNYLRASGFDVVEMKNYKTFKVPQTLVVDRVGDLGAARRVASALGISDKNVIQQINPDYFVDVSVIIGEDHSGLRPSR